MTLRRYLDRVKNSIWLYPTVYSIIAIILALSVIIIDGEFLFDFKSYIPEVMITSSELARMVLSLIAGAFITIMTFTFSTTMIVLTMYSSQFSPRVVENFLNDNSTMKSFGIFVSGFIYSIISLLFIRESISDSSVISGSIGVVYIIVGLVNFIIFINNVATHVQASNLIDRLFEESLSRMGEYKDRIKACRIVPRDEVNTYKKNLSINSPQNGYIQEVDYKGLIKTAKETRTVMFLDKVAGQFLTDRTEVITLYYDNSSDLKDDLEERIHRSLLIGDQRTEKQDFSFSLQKIVDVALKALSPGINDPNTAIHCIRILGVLLRNMAELENGYVLVEDEGEEGALYYEGYDFDVILSASFNQIIHYGKEDVSVTIALLKAFRYILETASDANSEIILQHVDFLWNTIMKKTYEELEMKLLKQERAEIRGPK
ncbi:MAG TPA: DUF2254 domain-containing protein [Clostridiaceae bacterium]|nr:DUF2254 domain-containing protein [Clostridiaceae bacterium]